MQTKDLTYIIHVYIPRSDSEQFKTYLKTEHREIFHKNLSSILTIRELKRRVGEKIPEDTESTKFFDSDMRYEIQLDDNFRKANLLEKLAHVGAILFNMKLITVREIPKKTRS